jgi:hypothetical protein
MNEYQGRWPPKRYTGMSVLAIVMLLASHALMGLSASSGPLPDPDQVFVSPGEYRAYWLFFGAPQTTSDALELLRE